MLLSIIIPVYNGAGKVERALDSIYSNNLDTDDFEIICVDDHSPDSSSCQAIEDYKVQNLTSKNNIRLIRHPENKRQGGARNTGVEAAKGEWIVYIDQDDYFCTGSLTKLIDIIAKNRNLELLMVDYETYDESKNKITDSGHYTSVNSQEPMSGRDYIITQEVPWTPWCTVYKREYLRSNNFRFEENVRFEDSDYVLKCIANSSAIQFYPLGLVTHVVSPGQQSTVGNNREAIIDLFKISDRVRQVALKYMDDDPKLAHGILGHHWHKHYSDTKKYLWRLPYKDINSVLTNYPLYQPAPNSWVKLIWNNPITASVILTIFKPLMLLGYRIYKCVKH